MIGRRHRRPGPAAPIGVATALALATSGIARADRGAEPRPDPRYTAVALTAVGSSFTLGDRRAVNRAPPSAEVRLGLRPRRARWAVAEVGLGITVYPELVPHLGLGLRVHPLTDVAYARHLFVRLGGSGLVALDGFDLSVGGEAGIAVNRQRVIGWVGLGADRFVIHPRLLVQGRVGVGVTF
jgi:hypothetical protein